MIHRLTEKIWVVEGGKNGRYPYAHSLYVADGGGYLVDAGSDPEEIERLRKGSGIAVVVMTHYHEDHFTYLSRLPDTEVWASGADAPALESLETLMDWYGVRGNEWDAFFRQLFAETFPFVPRKAARKIADGEELVFGDTRAFAVVAPGHTPGHLCLHFPDDGILFLGDYDLTSFGPWYGDAPCGIDAFRRSAHRLAGIAADRCVVSHEGPVHRGPIAEKMRAYLAVIDRREEALREVLREPRTRAEIIGRRLIYGPGRDGPWFDYGEWALLSKHLEGMTARGEAAFRDGAWALSR
ncbi:MAG: beta-lactamase domain protein [Deltaproteobacteria bacterium]|nr:beta-lactamase domain protein [Deltaproteobacteria bacterium]